MQSIIIRKSRNRPPVFHYPHQPANTSVNLFYRHQLANTAESPLTSIRKAAFSIAARIPVFSLQSTSHTQSRF